MKNRRLWVLGIGTMLVAFLIVACGGGATASPAAQPVPTQVSPATSISPPQPDNTAVAATTPPLTQADTATPAASDSEGLSATGYKWQVETVDDNGSKPSLAVDADGVPHIAYMLEAMPGFVKHAVASGEGWEISTVSTGYFYGPLDIQVGQDGVPQVSWHNHDEEDAAYAVLVDGEWESRSLNTRATTAGTITWP